MRNPKHGLGNCRYSIESAQPTERTAIIKDISVLLVIAAATRLAWGLLYWSRSPSAGMLQADAWSHFQLAREAYLAGSWKIADGPFYQPPFYTYLLLLLHHLGLHSVKAVAVFQSFVGLIVAVMCLWLARQILSRGWALGSAALVSATGPVILYEHLLVPTTVGAALHVTGLATLAAWWRSQRRGWLVAGGLVSGLASITRPHFLAAAVLQAIWVGWAWKKRHHAYAPNPRAEFSTLETHSGELAGFSGSNSAPPSRSASMICAVLVYAVSAAVGPMATFSYNMLIGGDRILICANGGVTFCMGNGPNAVGYLAPVPGLAPEIEKQRTESVRLASQAAGKRLKPSEASRWWYRYGINWLFQNPRQTFRLLMRKILLMWNRRSVGVNTDYGFESSTVPPLKLFEIPYVMILIPAVGSLVVLNRRVGPIGLLLFTSVVTYLVVSVLFYVSGRFIVGALPSLVILGSAWLHGQWARRGLGWRDMVGLIVGFVVVCAPAEWWVSMPAGTLDRKLHSLAWYNLGAAAERENRYAQAQEYYSRAVETDWNLGIAHKNLGVLLARSGRRDEAERHLRMACRLLPEDAQARRNLDIFLRSMHEGESTNRQENQPG